MIAKGTEETLVGEGEESEVKSDFSIMWDYDHARDRLESAREAFLRAEESFKDASAEAGKRIGPSRKVLHKSNGTESRIIETNEASEIISDEGIESF